MKHLKLFNQFITESSKSIPNSIGINSNAVKKALKTLDDKGINYKPLNQTIDGFEVYDLGNGSNVILALSVLQKRGIKVLDTERLGEKKIVISKSDMEKLHKDGKITIDDNEIEFVTEAKMSKERIEDMIWSLENEVKSWHPSSDSKKKAMLDKLRKDLSKFESVVTEAKSKFKIGDRVSILSKSSKKPFDSGEVTGIQKDGTILINGLETISHEVAIDAELVVKESVVTEAKLKISGPAYDFWNDRDVQRKLKDVKVKIVGDIGGVMTISGADNEIQKVKDIFGLNESAVTEGKYANKTMNEMLTDTYHKALEEAKAYEADDNKDHTLEEYLTEMASLTAEKMYEMYESSCNEMREGMTKEMYESSCNKMKEAYNSKMDEMLKEYKK